MATRSMPGLTSVQLSAPLSNTSSSLGSLAPAIHGFDVPFTVAAASVMKSASFSFSLAVEGSSGQSFLPFLRMSTVSEFDFFRSAFSAESVFDDFDVAESTE